MAQVSGTWGATGSLGDGRYAATAVLINPKVLLAGGVSSNGVLASAELYDPATRAWSTTGNLNIARNTYVAMVLLNGKVLVAGGCTTPNCSAATPTAELYDPSTGKWSSTGAMHTARDYHTATLLASGKVLVAGGFGGGNTAEVYDPSSGQWSVAASMLYAQAQHAAVRLANGTVLLLGGNSPSSYC